MACVLDGWLVDQEKYDEKLALWHEEEPSHRSDTRGNDRTYFIETNLSLDYLEFTQYMSAER